jgi:hypothetical protein
VPRGGGGVLEELQMRARERERERERMHVHELMGRTAVRYTRVYCSRI